MHTAFYRNGMSRSFSSPLIRDRFISPSLQHRSPAKLVLVSQWTSGEQPMRLVVLAECGQIPEPGLLFEGLGNIISSF